MPNDSELLGNAIDGFTLVKILGRGGMGVVYKARDTKLDRDVALKLMNPSLAHDEALMNRFRQEAKALARLQNPHIVTVYSLLETEKGVCIVMEYVQGITLSELIKTSGSLPSDRAIRLFTQLLSAFEHAHASGIIHRDVKPGNILVTARDEVKVTDFGLAKIFQQASTTVTSIVGGTLFYSSPEQIEGLSRVDQRGDIYSLGMTLYEALTGAVPFGETDSDFAIREKIVKGKIPSPKTIHSQIPRDLNRIVMKAIACNPADRYQTATDMKTDLSRAVLDVTSVPHVQKGVRISKSRKPIVIAGIVLSLIAAGILALLVFRPVEQTLTVYSSPPGAEVQINARLVGVTPVKQQPIEPGNVIVRMSKADYVSRETVLVVKQREPVVLSLKLDPIPGRSVLNQSPQAKTAPLEQREPTSMSEQKDPSATRGRSSESTATNQSGARIKAVESSQSRGQQKLPVVTKATRVPPSNPEQGKGFAASTTGKIKFEIIPSDAVVSVDGRRTMKGEQSVSPGQHKVRVVAGPSVWEKLVSVEAGATIELPINLTKLVRIMVVAVDAEGKGVRGSVIVDGKPCTLPTPLLITVNTGLHEVVVQKEGYQEGREKRNFEKDMIAPDVLKLKLSKLP